MTDMPQTLKDARTALVAADKNHDHTLSSDEMAKALGSLAKQEKGSFMMNAIEAAATQGNEGYVSRRSEVVLSHIGAALAGTGVTYDHSAEHLTQSVMNAQSPDKSRGR